MDAFKNNITDTALIFEGGGMRESYTAAVAVALMENGLYFSHVYGVSAGSSTAVNYLSRDAQRIKASFTTVVDDPRFGGIGSFLRHKGFFNSSYLYGSISSEDGALPFDYETFVANPAEATIAGVERDTGRTLYWSKRDFDSTESLMLRVRASSTLPVFMVPPKVEGRYCYDGGLGEGHGLLVEQAKRDGFERFFIVRTRPKAYRKPLKPSWAARLFFWHRPIMRKLLLRWGPEYNEICDGIERLEAEGAACIVYAEDITAKNSTTDLETLEKNYAAGYAHAQREMPRWKEFLGVA